MAGGVWSSNGDVRIEVALPARMAAELTSRDVEAFLALFAPGRDRELRPRVRFGFGRPGEGVERPLPPTAYDEGVRLVLPRGTRSLSVLPHSGPFFALRVGAEIVPIERESDAKTRRLFTALLGDEGGAGRLVVGPRADGAELVSVVGAAFEIDGRFSASAHAPYLTFQLSAPVGAGWHRITADLAGDRAIAPRLYAARNGEYHQAEAADLYQDGPGRYVGHIRLAGPVDQIRFDPCGVAGASGRLSALSLRKVPSPWLQALRPSVIRTVRTNRLSRKSARALLGVPSGDEHFGLPCRVARQMPAHSVDERASYDDWIAKFDFDPIRDRSGYERRFAELETQPLISVVMPVYKTPLVLLDEAIASVVDQIYPHWELCIADDCSDDARLKGRLEYWSHRDPRIKVAFCGRNGGISAATNAAFAEATGEWVALLDHDDKLRPHTLAEVALTANPSVQLMYSDEDKIDERGRRYDPFFKPDYSLHLLRSQNYFNHLTVHRASNIRAAGGWRPQFDGSQDFDLNLRVIEYIGGEGVVHIPSILYHWRAVTGSAAAAVDGKSYTFDAGMNALVDHLGRTEEGAAVGRAGRSPFYRTSYPLPDPAPSVTLVVPTRDRVDLLRLSVDSILDKTAYAPFEVLIVDNQSRDPETLAYFESMRNRKNVRVLKYDQQFNYSALNNFAVRHADGDLIGLVNNDVEVINPDWLWEMASLAAREEVGCVGAKLYYPDGSIQHGGVVIGIGSVAGHSHKYLPGDTFGYFGRMSVTHEVSAVTGACLLVKRGIYEEVGGLNETDLQIAFNDVDFCLRVRERGYINLMTPFAELYHHESVSRGTEDSPEKLIRFQKEVGYMLRRWRTDSEPDPYYSINLSNTHEDYRLRM